MAQTSPFAPYANFTARFQVQDASLITDTDGNFIPSKSWVEVTAVMQPSRSQIDGRDRFPGLDTNAIYMAGYVVSPLPDVAGQPTYLDNLIDWRTPASATIDGRTGAFYWDQTLRDPYLVSVKVDTVREFKGWFVDGATITITGDRYSTGRSAFNQSWTVRATA